VESQTKEISLQGTFVHSKDLLPDPYLELGIKNLQNTFFLAKQTLTIASRSKGVGTVLEAFLKSTNSSQQSFFHFSVENNPPDRFEEID